MRPEISITISHFHQEIRDYRDVFIRALETAGWKPRFAHDSLRPDILISSYYWPWDYSIEYYQPARSVFWSEEPIWKIRKWMPPRQFSDYDICLFPGHTDGRGDNLVSWPTWTCVFMDWWKRPMDFRGVLDTPELLCNRGQFDFPKTRDVQFAALSSYKWRDKWIRELNKQVTVDCSGATMHNFKDPDLADRKGPARWQGKMESLKKYKVSASFENRIGWQYCTEKCMHAFAVRAVPIMHTQNATPEIRRESFIPLDNFWGAVETIKNPAAVQAMSAEPVFADPEDIREKYGPHRLARLLTG